MSVLKEELQKLEGILYQNPETGAKGKDSYLGDYTNRIFGAPYQLMDSVDKRFTDINENLGNKYLKNFIINSPILHIRPGMPKYTGEKSGNVLFEFIRNAYINSATDNQGDVVNLLSGLAGSTIFGVGSKLQRRMFGFRETYYDYMQHVNYMCRSEAVFLNLTTGSSFPNGTFTSGGEFQNFSSIEWGNYRLLNTSRVKRPLDLLREYANATALGVIGEVLNTAADMTSVSGILNLLNPFDDKSLGDIFSSAFDNITQAFNRAKDETVAGHVEDKIASVEFMVEPLPFEESYTNQFEDSAIGSTVNAVADGVGNEIGFITNSHADAGMLSGVMDFLGNTAENAAMSISGLTQNLTGGFLTNLFTGAVRSIKGQKMIYPKIYKSSESSMDYNFSLILTTPYGDIYNYYMNIIVPLMHLIALVAPRLVSSNSTASPYLVQAYIPGQCTCHLGAIKNMTIQKNPDANHVSVNGFPLTVKVTFTIEELYNSMAISPANDPSSFLFNETLNDYMANLAGLIPSIDTYARQRQVMLSNLGSYIKNGGFKDDFVSRYVEDIEDIINPFAGR